MEQEEILQEPVYSQQVLEFLAVAHKYCQFMEQVYRQSAENISDFLVQILPLLYFRGSLLPVINHIEIEVVENMLPRRSGRLCLMICGKNFWIMTNTGL